MTRDTRRHRYGRLAVDLGTLLRQTRETKGITLDALADEHGITKGTLADLERGEDNPTLDRVDRVAAMYGLTLTLAPITPAHTKRNRPRQETLTP
jgi:transcriptional regulator with XRE-family HTH domain